MSAKTSIEWTDRTWNPIRGCTRVSEGCRNCYAERMAARGFDWAKGFATMTPAGPRWTGKVALIPELLGEPMRWKKPQRIFVNSMSDLFHESLPASAILAVFTIMARARQHTFQVLTKRPERMRALLSAWVRDGLTLREGHGVALPNVWLGTSVEDQATADERIPKLLQTPAAVRFISLEPQLHRVILANYKDWLRATPHLDLVIQGGESGPGARPFRVEWAYEMREECRQAGVAYFLKQIGAVPTWDLSLNVKGWPAHVEFRKDTRATNIVRLRNRKGGDPSEWPADLRVREFPR